MDVLPARILDAGSVLVAGSPMSGKYELFHRLLGDWADAPVVISTGRTAETVRADYERITGNAGDDVVVVDCVSRERGKNPADTPTTKYVASVGNLTTVGVEYTNVVEEAAPETNHAVGIYSISQLLPYRDPEAVYQFVRTVSSQAAGEGWSVVGVVASTMHDEQVLHTLYEPFERVVETRVEGDERQFRVRDRLDRPSGWKRF